ncbi:MAG: hypothetical protein NTV51_08200 [Verrucomicrobia bacterium]|nr:hypothetical protein [Verrucomicrobiota bacterium]
MTREEILPIVTTIARLGVGDEAAQQLQKDGLSEWDAELALVCVSTAFGRALLEGMEGGKEAKFTDELEIRATAKVPARMLYFSRLPVYTAALAVARECFGNQILPRDEAWRLMAGSAEARSVNEMFLQGTKSISDLVFTSILAPRLEDLTDPRRSPPEIDVKPSVGASSASNAAVKKPWWKVW